MCCFASPVISVDNTKIFGRLDGDGNQYLAYEMRFESETENAMILPLPVALPAADSSIEFIDLSGYDQFFSALRSGFPNPRPPANSRTLVDSIASNKAPLRVYDVGEFIASFVPSITDFSRVDSRFSIPKNTWEKIPLYSDYSFAVFQFKQLRAKVHPMAFRFKTRHPESVFFPTVHIHDGEVHKKEHFDHDLYMQHASLDGKAGRYTGKRDKATGVIRSNKDARFFVDIDRSKGLVAPDLLVHRKQLKGNLSNKDLFEKIAGDPLTRSTSSLDQMKYYLPVAGMLLPAAWIIRRRNVLKSKSEGER